MQFHNPRSEVVQSRLGILRAMRDARRLPRAMSRLIAPR
jgi:hypothetical protein